MSGKVTLVGAGPGDPGLLTVKGLRALEQAEVVVYDRLVSPAVLELIPSAARRIRALLDAPLMVEEGDGLRPVRPSDVMILLRSPGPVLHHYIQALEEEGVPWSAGEGKDFFQTTQVNVALAILQIVDNPRQDVPLIAALRSPVFGFTGDELALLRADSGGDL